MTKKSFKENPALSFISQALSDTQADTATQKHTDKHTHAPAATSVHADTSADVPVDTHTSKQEEVETAFQAQAVRPPAATPPAATQELFAGIVGRESKSKRLQLLLRPSTHEGIAELARAYHTSVNDIINQILEDYLRRTN